MNPINPMQGGFLPRTKNFMGAAMSPSEPTMQYVRLKKEGVGFWFKGQVTEAFPPEGDRDYPWDVKLKGIGEPNITTGKYNSYEATVVPGTLSGFLPTNWEQKFTVPGEGLSYAKAIVSTDGEAITSVSIKIDGANAKLQTPQKNAIESSVEFLFGVISEGASVRTIALGHITLVPRLWFSVPKENAAPADPKFENYYVLL